MLYGFCFLDINLAHRVLQPGSSLVNYTICTGKLALLLSVAFPYHFSFVLTSYFTPFIHFQDILPEIVIFPSTYVFVQLLEIVILASAVAKISKDLVITRNLPISST
jgi:hypothetical protein